MSIFRKVIFHKSLGLAKRAHNATKREMWLSLKILSCITVVLWWLFYHYEHKAQPEVFGNCWQALAWTVTRYLDNLDGVVDKYPITIIGKIVAVMLSIVAIGIVAIPAGLIGSGLTEAINEEKKENHLKVLFDRLKKSFRRKQCRYTKYRTVPQLVSIVDIQAKQCIDTNDIIEAVKESKDFRLRNLATAQPLGSVVNDRLVVEHFPINTPYGCKVDCGSNVTIVSTSSVSEAGIGNFSWYLALYGGFNYVSKEVEDQLLN